MGKKVSDAMTQPRCATPETPLSEVAEIMQREDVGAVPVILGERLVGMITDRDIVVRAIAAGKDPRGMPAREIASDHVFESRGSLREAPPGGASRSLQPRQPDRQGDVAAIRSGCRRHLSAGGPSP